MDIGIIRYTTATSESEDHSDVENRKANGSGSLNLHKLDQSGGYATYDYVVSLFKSSFGFVLMSLSLSLI